MPKTHFATSTGKDFWGPSLAAYGYPPAPSGNVWFVQSTNPAASDAANYGHSPDAPLATIAYAVAHCVPDNEDVIVVLPGHVETVTGAAGVLMSVAGVRVIGQGKGRQRPKINFTTAIGASFDITAARCSVENVTFVCGFDAITAMINVQAADFTLENCEVEFADSSNQAVLALLTTAAADRLLVENCHFHGSATAGTAAGLRIVGGDAVRIKNNVVIGNFTTTLGGIDNATTACTNLLVEGNKVTNRTASASVAINAQAGTTGQVVNNRLSVLTGTAPIVAAGINLVGGNYYSAAAGVTAGALI